MKILQMSRCFFPYQAGASVRTYQIAKNLVKRGHEVHLLVHHPKGVKHATIGGEVSLEENYEGIHVHRLPYFGPQYLYFFLTVPMMALMAMKIIKKEGIDTILSENPPYIVGLASYLAAKATGKPLFIDAHDPWGSAHHKRFDYHLGMFLEGFCCRKANAIFCASSTLPKTLEKRHGVGSKCKIVLNGVDVEEFKVLKTEVLRVRKKYKIPDKKVVFFIGSLAKWNGVQYLISAAKNLGKDSIVVIAGGGIDEDEFKDMAKGLRNIIFTGVVPYKDVAPLLALANVCVAPLPKVENVGWESYEAPVPIHLLEYMAAGKPIVGSDVHIVAELLSNGRGYLAEAENAEKLAEGIRYLLINKDIAIAMGKKAIDYIKRENSWSNQIEVVAGVLKSNGKASILE